MHEPGGRRPAARFPGGGGAVMTMPQTIPMCEPDITVAEQRAVQEVLLTSTLSIGPRLELFERRVAAYVGARHAAGVSSGTAGLHLCMLAAGVGEYDLVITTPFSFVASANSIMYVRARPVFVDIEPKALAIDPQRLADTARTLARRHGRLAHSRLGYNYRLDELSAALGAVQAERLDELLEGRERVAAWYTARLAGLEGVEVPARAPWTTRMSWFVYVVRLAPRHDRDR